MYSTKINIMKLLKMTDFIISQIKTDSTVNDSFKKDLADVRNYALFLKQPLTLGMFVPCDENGNILEKPDKYDSGLWHHADKFKVEDYRKAKEKVLFNGFSYKFNIDKDGKKWEYVKNKFPHVFSLDQLKNNTVESLLTRFKKEYLIELTESAIKQIFG